MKQNSNKVEKGLLFGFLSTLAYGIPYLLATGWLAIPRQSLLFDSFLLLSLYALATSSYLFPALFRFPFSFLSISLFTACLPSLHYALGLVFGSSSLSAYPLAVSFMISLLVSWLGGALLTKYLSNKVQRSVDEELEKRGVTRASIRLNEIRESKLEMMGKALEQEPSSPSSPSSPSPPPLASSPPQRNIREETLWRRLATFSLNLMAFSIPFVQHIVAFQFGVGFERLEIVGQLALCVAYPLAMGLLQGICLLCASPFFFQYLIFTCHLYSAFPYRVIFIVFRDYWEVVSVIVVEV